MRKTKIKLSIIVPIYNSEKYLPDCLDSILNNQKLNNLEVILVNDGSTDKSGDICLEYMKKGGGIFKYIETRNSGLSEARNNGLRLATGDLIWFVDSDDKVSSDSVVFLTSQRKIHDIAMIDYFLLIGNERIKPNNDIVKDPVRRYLINTPLAQIRIFKKSFLDKIGFRFEKGRYYEDSGSMYGLVKYTNDIFYTNKPFYEYRKHSGSITMDGKIEAKSNDRYWAARSMLNAIPEEYKDERDYQVIKSLGLFYTFDIFEQVKKKSRKKMLDEARAFMEVNIPRYWDNSYVKRKTTAMRGYRMYLKCLHLRAYSICNLISKARRKLIK